MIALMLTRGMELAFSQLDKCAAYYAKAAQHFRDGGNPEKAAETCIKAGKVSCIFARFAAREGHCALLPHTPRLVPSL